MKETVSVSISSQAFTLDDDAYQMLRRYLDDIRRRLPPEDTDTMEDVEARIAELFRERLSSPMMVVPLAAVEQAVAQLGQPDEFGQCTPHPSPEADETRTTSAPRKLYRSRSDRSIAGVCGGLARYLGTDPLAIRLITLFLILFGGLSIWAYILLWVIVPEEPLNLSTRN